jgi:hypothetical protein
MSELSTTSRPGVSRPIAIWALLLATAVGAASACQPKAEDVANGDDPIAALDARVRSTRYDGPYWQQQRLAGSDVWQRAVATCTPERATERPNCEPVVANARAEQGNARADSVLRAAGAAAGGRR